jgi:hypothetical protein
MKMTRPRPEQPGSRTSGTDQARTVSALGRTNQRASSAWPPNSAAL